MTDKLDFSGFGDQLSSATIPAPTRKRPATRKPSTRATKKPSRRKVRVNVSLEPSTSLRAVENAGHRGMTLSDLLRAAFRDHASSIKLAWFDPTPAPFEHRSPAATGRVVHMLYLTSEEVAILDDLAATNHTSRSRVVGALLNR